jgi:CheY-like chemotaxis protein
MAAPCAVLLVEDDDPIREVFAEMLSLEGFAVRTAANGREALAVLHQWRPDVILLDLDMPEMDGRAFRAEQRRLPQLAAIPVVVLSAVTHAASVAELQVAEVLRKPCNIEALVTAIRRVIDGWPQGGQRGGVCRRPGTGT